MVISRVRRYRRDCQLIWDECACLFSVMLLSYGDINVRGEENSVEREKNTMKIFKNSMHMKWTQLNIRARYSMITLGGLRTYG